MFDSDKAAQPLTESEKQIRTYIEEHPSDIPQMTISALAKETSTSNATILRFCRKYGLSGYPALKEYLIRSLEAQKYEKTTVDFSYPIEKSDNTLEVIRSMTSLHRESIDILCSSLNPGKIQTVSEILARSPRLFFYAAGDTMTTVEGFISKLIKLDCFPVLATSRSDYNAVTEHIRKEDTAIFVSYRGNAEYLKTVLPLLKKSGCTIITITAASDSPMAKAADINLLIPRKETEDRISTFYSQLAFSYLFSILYGLLYRRRKQA